MRALIGMCGLLLFQEVTLNLFLLLVLFLICVPPSAPFRASAPPIDPDFPAEEEED